MNTNFCFLCAGKEGYWIFEDREYSLHGMKRDFSSLSNIERDDVCLTFVDSGAKASMIVSALNFYFKYFDPEKHG